MFVDNVKIYSNVQNKCKSEPNNDHGRILKKRIDLKKNIIQFFLLGPLLIQWIFPQEFQD